MKIIEARDGFINFEANDSIYLSSFVLAEGMDKSYVAQVNQMKKFGNILIASAKILFIYNGKDLLDYDRTLPSRDSELSVFPLEIIQNSINSNKPVVVGKTLDGLKNIFMDLSAFNKRTLVSIDDKDINNIIVCNLTKQFEHLGQKTIVIDTLGVVKGEKYVAGRDFKLPLDTSTLEFMYKSCLNDATEDSKAIIAEVFTDLSEYSKTVPFVPFEVLKSIVDEMVDEQHIFKLFVLKNRLANFERLGYFATKQSEVDKIDAILSSKEAIIDLSKLNVLFQNRFLEYIYTKIDTQNTQVLMELSNTVSKKNLKNILIDSDVPATLIVNSKYQYLSDIKQMLKNFIIESTITNNERFRVYCTFLSSMQEGMYLIAGEDINYIPMVSQIQEIEDTIEIKAADDESSLTDIDDKEMEEMLDVQEVDTDIKEGLTQEEIIAAIEDKSNDAINTISENIEETTEINLFDDEQSEDIDDEEIEKSEEEDSEELKEEIQEDIEEEINNTSQEEPADDVIEPEYEEIPDTEEQAAVDDNALGISEEEPLEIKSEHEDISTVDTEALEEDYKEDFIQNDIVEETYTESEDVILEEDSYDELINIAEDDAQIDVEQEFIEDEQEEDIILSESEEDEDLSLSDDSESFVEEEEASIELESDEELLLEEADNIVDTSEKGEFIETSDDFVEPSIMPLNEEEYSQSEENQEQFIEDDIKDDDIIIDIDEDNDGMEIDEDVDRQIVEDVDKVFTTARNDEEIEDISDSDLDLIDALNSDEDEELEQYQGELEEVSDSQIDEGILDQPSESIIPPRQSHKDDGEILEKKEANTPIVPVYDADIPQEDMVVSDSIQQGDSVVHAKYGNGVVEKMIKYGTKTLFSINFENIGRRLLDPTLTEIKKL